jgi:TRAP transporter 4TM/12TM fusion protein
MSSTAPSAEPAVSAEALRKAERYIEEEEGAVSRLRGRVAWFITAVAVTMSLYHLYCAYGVIPTQMLRATHLGFVLFLCFLLFPMARRYRNRVMWFDVLLALASVAAMGYMLMDFDDFIERAVTPTNWDLIFGVALVLLVLEAARRSTGWVMPIVVVAFIAYAMAGPYLPHPWTHRGYDVERLVGHMYMTLEGIFGVALDVSATLIILFTIYGAVLQHSGAGKFFIDFSFAATGGKATSAGRTIVFSSFLLGGPSGSGVATTVTLGAVAYPLLAKAGYGKNEAGGLLAAGGLGAILSPPVLGAAAFLIAEFLKISYLDVIRMAIVPTVLYYLSLFIMVELDARRLGMHSVAFDAPGPLWQLTRRYGFHFLSLAAIVVFMVLGFSPMMAVLWATVLAFASSFIVPECALKPRKLIRALEDGSVGMLGIAATCAAAGIIVGVVTLTGLGLKFSDIVIGYAGGNLILTALYSALIVWIVGLAVPVTASYIICAVIAAPALIKLGVPDYAAHMFIFYYAVLSEVSPPTALSPFAAAAITGGDPYRTTLQAWKYTLPAFLVPFVFVLDPAGQGVLLKGPIQDIIMSSATAMLGIATLASGAQNWLLQRCALPERLLLIAAGLLLVYPKPLYDWIGIALIATVLGMQKLRK